MTDQDAAHKIIRVLYAPIFTIKAVTYAADVKPEVIRNWLSRRHFILQYSETSGQGSRTFFSFYDILQAMITAELSRLSVDPKDTKNFMMGIMISVVGNIEDIAADDGNSMADRYIIFHHSNNLEHLALVHADEPNPELPETVKDISRIVLDCRGLAKKSCEIIRTMPRGY